MSVAITQTASATSEPKLLPKLRSAGPIYLSFLLILALIFYLLLLGSMAAVGWLFYKLIIYTPTILRHVHTAGGIKLLIVIYLFAGTVLLTLIAALFESAGGDPVGIKCNRIDHDAVFKLTDKVALKVGAKPIEQIFITPECEIGVWEEAAIFLPPGFGRRKLVLGMGALSYLTVNHLVTVLAHEYGHFSSRDTFFSRFIYRVHASYRALAVAFRGSKARFVNPTYWVLTSYVFLYSLVSASFSRRREFAADRFAVEAFGQKAFEQGLVAACLESQFFNSVGVRRAIQLAKDRMAMSNIYHAVGVQRKLFDQSKREAMLEPLVKMLEQKAGGFDSHPSLLQRLQAQGIVVHEVQLHTPPRVALDQDLETTTKPDLRTLMRQGPPSAAEYLFGQQLPMIQKQLSEMLAAKYHYLVQLAKVAARGGI